MITTTASKRLMTPQSMIRRKGRPLTHRMIWMATATACSTSTHAWSPVTNPRTRIGIPISSHHSNMTPITTMERLYSSSKHPLRRINDDDDSNEFFGFRRAARKVLPTKWFGTKQEKQALERKQIVKDRVRGELDELLKGAPLPIQLFGKYVAAPMMGKIASKVAEAGFQQQETMEAILDQARDLLLRDAELTSLLGTPIQIGAPFSQRSSMTVINGSRQMRTEFEVEVSGPYQNGVARIIATNEGIGQLLVESNGKVYNANLTSEGKRRASNGGGIGRSSNSSRSSNDDDTIIEAEIIDKKEETKRR